MEHKDRGFVGKHYLIKQAFGQEELHQREAVCTREDPPGCSAACPLHLDVRTICAYGAKGDFGKAAGVIRGVTPFLHLLAKACPGMCQEACALSRVGEGIQMKALEKACALYGGNERGSRFLIPRKNKKVIVAGEDLFALACCWELGKKGYEIFWYTRCQNRKEPLLYWNLTEEEAERDSASLSLFRITQKMRTGSEEEISEWAEQGDALCLSPDLWRTGLPENSFGMEKQWEEREGAVWILAWAKYAAAKADRYLQGASFEGLRQPGPEESHLYVTMDGVEGSKSLAGPENPDRGQAEAEAGRCIQCRCLECVKGCVYLQEYKRNPRGAVREIYNNLSIVMGNHMANGMINACDLCGQCKAACPKGFDYPEVCQMARKIMVETEKMPPSAHEFGLLDQQFSCGEGFLARLQPGYDRCRYLFFPGCQASAVSPDTVEAAYKDLSERLSGGVGLILGCCGALSQWAGREDLSEEALEKIRSAWKEMGEPEVICACPTCLRILRERTEIPAAGVWQKLLELGIDPVTEETVAIQDACGARGDQETQDQIRSFVSALGCRIEEAPLSRDLSPCCGYGGMVRFANPEMSEKKASFAAGRTSEKILTYCMACRDQLTRAGADSVHILELAYGTGQGPVPDLSKRRANRLKLKEKLLKEIWKEEIRREIMLPVFYENGAEEEMDRRMILKSDVDAVLKAYEASGEAVEDPEKGWLAASARIGNVTFWVKFRETEKGYLVYGAYSHRMAVE